MVADACDPPVTRQMIAHVFARRTQSEGNVIATVRQMIARAQSRAPKAARQTA